MLAAVLLVALAAAPESKMVQLRFENGPNDAVVRCLEGCGAATGRLHLGSKFPKFSIDGNRATVQLELIHVNHLSRTIEIVVEPGTNTIDAKMMPRP